MNYFFRHPVHCTTQPRKAYATVKAMRAHREAYPRCAWCGSGKVHVHHLEPIQFAPERAADPGNFISLCGKRCHLTVGHAGNWKQFVENCQALCDQGVCVKPVHQAP